MSSNASQIIVSYSERDTIFIGGKITVIETLKDAISWTLIFFRLFNIVDVELRQFSPTFRTFLRLLDNYIYVTKVEESYTEVDQREMEDFLDEVIASRTMKTLHDFLVARGKLFWGWGAGGAGV